MSLSIDVPRRVIIHIDLDCFYAQVEQKRLDIPRDTPCAVQQWDGLIAVNYAARAKGITRHMRVAEAKRACPELQLVHVRTIGEGGTDGAAQEGSAATRGKAKACLQRYRQASGEIIRLLQSQLAPGTPFEKGGLDEMFMDVTAMADEEVRRLQQDGYAASDTWAAEGAGADLCGELAPALLSALQDAAGCSAVVGGALDPHAEYDQRLIAGALIARRLRAAVFEQLQFTCSAGVAHNKLLAKLGSSQHKPNKQALVLPRGVADMMKDLPVGKIWGLGGKLGTALEQQFGATTAGQAAAVSLGQLQKALGEEKGRVVYHLVRGISCEPVVPKSLVKSINSCKSFEATSDLGVVEKWVVILAEELAERLAEDEAEHRRRARTLTLHYRGGSGLPGSNRPGPAAASAASGAYAGGERSVRCHLPVHGREGPSSSAIAASVMTTFRKLPDALPCARLAISAADFSDMPLDSTRTITRFFAPAPAAPRPPAPAATQAESAGPCPKRVKVQHHTQHHLPQVKEPNAQAAVQDHQAEGAATHSSRSAPDPHQAPSFVLPQQQYEQGNKGSMYNQDGQSMHVSVLEQQQQQQEGPLMKYAGRQQQNVWQANFGPRAAGGQVATGSPAASHAAESPAPGTATAALWLTSQEAVAAVADLKQVQTQQQPQSVRHDDDVQHVDANRQGEGVELLSEVDLEQQRRILHDIEVSRMLQRARSSTGTAGRPATVTGGGRVAGRSSKGRGQGGVDAKQMKISSMFRKS